MGWTSPLLSAVIVAKPGPRKEDPCPTTAGPICGPTSTGVKTGGGKSRKTPRGTGREGPAPDEAADALISHPSAQSDSLPPCERPHGLGFLCDLQSDRPHLPSPEVCYPA
ncbi:hypothetical protein BHE74_00050209 [Ensete ventricosum]|nr:hypothetical protein BHE74_00050209 [Ensete ventricosum]